MKWSLGFVFNTQKSYVLLLRKGRTLHIGQWNGLGGELAEGEDAATCMQREGLEEAGKYVGNWEAIGAIDFTDGGRVDVFATTNADVAEFRVINLAKGPLGGPTSPDLWPDDKPIWVPVEEMAKLRLAPFVIDFVKHAVGQPLGEGHEKLQLMNLKQLKVH